MAEWAWWEKPNGDDEHRIRELLRAVWDLHASYDSDDPWLWRGQARGEYNLEPALHTRIRRNAVAGAPPLSDVDITLHTKRLVDAAKDAQLNRHEGVVLPEMALLAMLQHHGAATALLDVTLDPLLALYMAVVSPDPADDKKDGALFAIRRPQKEIAAFDTRTFSVIYDSLATPVLYRAPDVSERLRIQRGHFLLGKVRPEDPRVPIPLLIEAHNADPTWLQRRMEQRGEQGAPVRAATDVAVFRIRWQFKDNLRKWLENRSGLTRDFIYPTAWHQPHLDRFAMSHGRSANF